MHGIITMVEGELVPLFASVLVAADGTGAGLAALIVQMLTNGKPFTLGADLVRRSLTCLPFDGQYQSANEGHDCGLAVAAHVREASPSSLALGRSCLGL